MAYKEKSPIPVVEGGTGSTSFGTTDGTVYYNGTNLVATATGTAGQLLTSNGAGVAPTFQTAAASSITITGDSGGGLTGNSFTFTGDTTGLTFAGAGTTETLGGTLVVGHGGTGATTLTGVLTGNGTSAFTASAVTQHDVLVGGVSNAITSVAPSATSGVPLISQGAAADPAFGTAVVAGGGTGATTFTANGVLLGNTTSAITATAPMTARRTNPSAAAVSAMWPMPTTARRSTCRYPIAATTATPGAATIRTIWICTRTR